VRSLLLERTFRKLFAAGYEITSPQSTDYNCIAWAAHDIHHKWWPNDYGYWPGWVKREETIPSFIRAFRLLGYRECGDSCRQFGYEKVAVYAIGKAPKHMARQLLDGSWTSKLGDAEDITHYTLDAVESYGPAPFYGEYGAPVVYMRRLLVVSWVVRFIQFVWWKVR